MILDILSFTGGGLCGQIFLTVAVFFGSWVDPRAQSAARQSSWTPSPASAPALRVPCSERWSAMVVQMQVLSVDSVEMAPALMLSTETQRCGRPLPQAAIDDSPD